MVDDGHSFRWFVRVYWEDTDAGGVVYYANYLKFLERARTEWVRSRGVDQAALRSEHQIVMVVRSVQCDFLAPARLEDELAVTVAPVAMGAASMDFEQEIVHRGRKELLVSAHIRAACLDSERWRPRRFPPPLRAAFAMEKA